MMYESASPADTTDVILSNDTVHNTDPVFPTTHITHRQSKKEIGIRSIPIVDKLNWSALTLVVKMILFADLQDSSRLYYITTNSI